MITSGEEVENRVESLRFWQVKNDYMGTTKRYLRWLSTTGCQYSFSEVLQQWSYALIQIFALGMYFILMHVSSSEPMSNVLHEIMMLRYGANVSIEFCRPRKNQTNCIGSPASCGIVFQCSQFSSSN